MINPNALKNRFKFAFKYFLVHLFISFCVALVLGILVFFVWYPEPFREMVGGLELFKLIIAIDIICGPLLTLLIISPKKKNKEKIIDISLIASIQITALIYGLYSIAIARPVAIVFEYNRFRLVRYLDIDKTMINQALPEFQKIPLFTIQNVSLRKQRNDDEINANMQRYLSAGIEIGMMPEYWIPYSQGQESVWETATPIPFIANLPPKQKEQWQQAVNSTGKKISELRYHLLLTPTTDDWVTLVNRDGNILFHVKIPAFK